MSVENYYGLILNVSKNYDDGNSYVDLNGINFIVLKSSSDIDQPNTVLVSDYPALNQSKYSVSSALLSDIISARKFKELISEYSNDYSALKKKLNVPNNVDFSFGIQYSGNDGLTAERNIPKGVEIFSSTNRLEFLQENGQVIFGNFWVKVW